MKIEFKVLAIAVVVGSVQMLSAAEISGKVKLKGTPPPELKIELNADCGKLHTAPIFTRHYVVGADGGLANVFVYIKSGVTKKYDPPPTPALLDQKGCEYQPYVMGIVTGQELAIKNSDSFMHNVHAMPKFNKEFNIGQPLKDQVTKKVLDKAEILAKFKCDVHQWMFAYVGVVDHPFFAVTDKDGSFKIFNLPAGKYTIEAYHLKAHGVSGPGLTQEITVTDTDKKEVNFTVEPKPVPAN